MDSWTHGQVFKTSEKLTEFVGLRVRYLLTILKETLTSMADGRLRLDDVNQEALIDICGLAGEWKGNTVFQHLVVFDSIQFANFWVTEWTKLLGSASSREDLVTKLEAAGRHAQDAVPNLSLAQKPCLSWQSFKKVATTASDADRHEAGAEAKASTNDANETASSHAHAGHTCCSCRDSRCMSMSLVSVPVLVTCCWLP